VDCHAHRSYRVTPGIIDGSADAYSVANGKIWANCGSHVASPEDTNCGSDDQKKTVR
jgi:hypothetical protein